MKIRQAMHVIHQLLVHRKTHQHPTHQHWRIHWHHHKLMRQPVNQRHLAALRLARTQPGDGLQHRNQRQLVLPIAHGPQRAARVQQGSHRGANAFPVVVQHGPDGFKITRTHGGSKAKVSSQQRRPLPQFLRILVQQTQPHPLPQKQFFGNLRPRTPLNGGPDHRENRQLNGQQQKQRQSRNARRQTTPAGRHGRPPHGAERNGRRVRLMLAAPTASA